MRSLCRQQRGDVENVQYAADEARTAEWADALPRQRGTDQSASEQGVAPCADEVAHAERLHGLVRRVLETGARTVRDPRALAVLVGVTDADRVYVASVLALQ